MAVKPEEDSNEDGEAEEKEEEPDEPQPEVGPPLLSPLSQDAGPSLTPKFLCLCCTHLGLRSKLIQCHS